MSYINILSDCSKKDAELVKAKLELHGVECKLAGGNKKGANLELQIKEADLMKAINLLKE